MNIKSIIISFSLMCIFVVKAKLQFLDSIKAVIFTEQGTEIVIHSEVQLPSLQGGVRVLDDIIFERLVCSDAKKHHIGPKDDGAVDRYLDKIMKDNNLKPEDLKQIFSQGGRMPKEGREELKRIQAVNEMFDFKIRSNLIVPRKDVQAYYQEHPEIDSARYQFESAQIQLRAGVDREKLRKKIEYFIKTGEGIKIAWSKPFWLEKNNLAVALIDLRPGEISQPIETDNGFQLYKLKNKKVRSLEERYREIVNILIQPMYKRMMAQYRGTLFKSASIIRF